MLHIPTVLAISATLAATYGLILLSLWLQQRGQVAMRTWGAAYLLGAAGLGLMMLRGMAPDIVTVQLANAVMALVYGVVWAGARQFGGGRPHLAGAVAGSLAWLAACQVPAFYESIPARVTGMAMIAAGYYLAAAWEFRPHDGGQMLRSQRLIIGLLVANAVAYLLRIPGILAVPVQPAMADIPASPFAIAFLLIGIATGGSLILGLVALLREKEEREGHAALLEARDAADRASAGKTRFLAHMSHELRTPLNGVLGLAQALAQDPALPPTQRERAAMLERAGRHLNALLNDILDLSSIEAGRLQLVATPSRLHPLLDEVAGLARAGAEAKGLHLRIELAPDLPGAVLGDPLRIRQILHNLLNNAIKFTPPGGAVTLAVRRGEPSGLLLTVTDDGPGVPEDLRDRLFQDYARATREAAKGDGTGLGLAISAGLAQAMEGSIRFGTPPGGKGSLFEVWLPLPEAEMVAEAPHPPAPIPCPTGLHVLVVDDVTVNRLVLRAILEPAGHRVSEAADGQGALDLLEASGPLPDLVLMDVLMPGLDGLEATRRIRALPGPAARLRILAVTASAMPDQIAECLRAGMDGHLNKPVDRRVLLASLPGAEP